MNTTIETTPGSGIAEYRATTAAMAKMHAELDGKTWDCSTGAGRDEAQKSLTFIVRLRTSLEATRKDLNTDDKARIDARNKEAKRITSDLVDMEAPIRSVLKADEDRREAIRAAKERAERQRLDAINARLAEITGRAEACAWASSVQIGEKITELCGQDFAEEDDVHGPDFLAAQDNTLIKLREMRDIAAMREAEDVKLEADRAELERQKAAQAETQRKIDAQLAEIEAAVAEQQATQRRLDNEAAERQRVADLVARREMDRLAVERREAEEAEAKRVAELEDAELQAEIDTISLIDAAVLALGVIVFELGSDSGMARKLHAAIERERAK